MRRQLPVLATLVASVAFVAACSGGGADAITGPAAPSTITIEFSYIDVIQDCDGIEGDGDFTFRIYGRQKDFTDELVYESSPVRGPGARIAVGTKRSYSIPASEGDSYVDVGFEASEWDRDIFGTTYPDARLDGYYDMVQHKLTNAKWSKLGAQTITLGNSNDCQVRLTYTAYKP